MPNLRGKTWTTTTPATVGDAQYWEDHLISDADAAKIGTAVQTVNNTSPDASGNVNVVALPAGGTAGQVLTKQSSTAGDADWEDPSSSGHTIQDEDGTTMPYESTLQFVNADVTDDSANGKTVVDCKGAKGDPGSAATVTVGTTTTLPAGSNATVTNSGTTSAAVFNFGIPKGADGTNGTDGTDGEDGVSVTGVSLLSTSGKVKTYRMTFSDNTYFDYNVTDGSDGTGAGDMLANDYDPDSSVYNAGGIPLYVAGVLPVITNTYSSTSEDGMSGKAVASAISGKADASSLATVATSGSYNDLSSKPTIPTITDSYDGTSSNGMSGKAVKQAIDALDVTTSGAATNKTVTALSQTDGKISATFSNISITKSQVSDFPTIPTVNNYTITIQRNGTTVDSFTTNASADKTINIVDDAWTATATVANGQVLFSGLDDTNGWGYTPYFNITTASTNKNPSATISSISGTGTANMSITYDTDADSGASCKLRIEK